MAMRYIIRRQKPEDLSDIKAQVPDLETKLGAPREIDRTADITLNVTPVRTVQFVFQSRKTASGWEWICPTIELAAENEKGLFALTKMFNAPKPSHLAHLPD